MRSATGSGSIWRMLMVSHIDADHITGLVDMFWAMKKEEEDTGETFCRICTLWFNSFEKLTGGKAVAVAQSAAVSAALNGVVPAGLEPRTQASPLRAAGAIDLRNLATTLAIPMNQGAGGDLVKAPEEGRQEADDCQGSQVRRSRPQRRTARKA